MAIGGVPALHIREVEVKAAGSLAAESKSVRESRGRDTEAALSNPAIAEKVKNQNIVAILVLMCVAVLVYLFFFVLT